VGRCKFGLDCSHDHEPGCAIRKAVAEGKIAPRRYATFQRLRLWLFQESLTGRQKDPSR
jgi:putative ribosome biogenesis GTPase RsgA